MHMHKGEVRHIWFVIGPIHHRLLPELVIFEAAYSIQAVSLETLSRNKKMSEML